MSQQGTVDALHLMDDTLWWQAAPNRCWDSLGAAPTGDFLHMFFNYREYFTSVHLLLGYVFLFCPLLL